MSLGEYIANYRREHNYSARELGKLCGLSHVQIIRMETEKRSDGKPLVPTIKSLKKLAAGMGVRFEDVLYQCKDMEIQYDADDITFVEPDAQYIIGKVMEATPEQLSKIKSIVDFVMQ